jgi:hypothetical protein
MTTEPGTTKTTDPGTTKTTEIGKTETTAADKTTRQQTTQVTAEPTRKTKGNKMHDCFLVIICNLISHCLLTCFYTFIVITFLFIYVENRRE